MKHPTSFRTSDVKQSNLLSILKFVRSQSVATKPSIGEALGLSRPTVNNLVDELIQTGLLQVSGMGSPGPSGGKPPSLITLNEQAGLVLGVALGPQKTFLALTDLNARILCRHDFPTNHRKSHEYWIEQFTRAYYEIISQAPYSAPLIGIGMAVTGLVESATGKLTYAAHMPEWNNVHLTEQISNRIGIPVYTATVAYAYAVEEKLFGAAADADNFIGIYIGEAVGAGIFIDGSLYHGAHGSAGEIGHTSLFDDDTFCYCGNQGCLETMISSPAILKTIHERLAEGNESCLTAMVENTEHLQLRHVGLAVQQNDPLCMEVTEEVGRRIGITIAFILNMYNPGKIILCGEITELGEPLLQSIIKQVNKRSLAIAAKETEIIFSSVAEQSSTIAGATLVIHQLFSGETDLLQLSKIGI